MQNYVEISLRIVLKLFSIWMLHLATVPKQTYFWSVQFFFYWFHVWIHCSDFLNTQVIMASRISYHYILQHMFYISSGIRNYLFRCLTLVSYLFIDA